MKYGLVTALLILILCPFSAFANSLDWANGVWTLDPQYLSKEEILKYNCETNPLTITINKEKNIFKSKQHKNDISKAKILTKSANSFEIMYENEERVMDNGELQVWTMHFLGKNYFVWVRQDWIIDGRITNATSPRMRCPMDLVS